MEEATSHIKVMQCDCSPLEDFLACGTAEPVVTALVEKKGVKDLTIVCNDTGFQDSVLED